MNLPNDPYILLSYINTKLRNDFDSIDDLCDNMEINQDQLLSSLSSIGYTYDQDKNQFITND